MSERMAVYAGSFDPPTNGHIWMIERGARSKLFDRLIVAIGVNPEKRYMFSAEQRMEMLQKCVEDFPGVTVSSLGNLLLIHYAHIVGAKFILRGIRNGNDYRFESAMCNVNSDLNSGITTIFLMPPRELAEISSSMIKGFTVSSGWERVVQRYVPEFVLEKLKEVKSVGKSNGTPRERSW